MFFLVPLCPSRSRTSAYACLFSSKFSVCYDCVRRPLRAHLCLPPPLRSLSLSRLNFSFSHPFAAFLHTARSPSSKANSFTMPLIYDRQHAVLEKQRMANYRVTRGDAREMSAKHGGGGGGSRHRSGTAGSRRRRQRSQSAPVPQFIRNLRSPEPAEEEVLQDVLVARGSPPKGNTVATATAAATVKGSLSGEGAGGPGYGGYSNSLDGKRIRAPAHRNAGGPVPRGAGPILQPAWSVAKIQNPNEAAEATSDTLGYE